LERLQYSANGNKAIPPLANLNTQRQGRNERGGGGNGKKKEARGASGGTYNEQN